MLRMIVSFEKEKKLLFLPFQCTRFLALKAKEVKCIKKAACLSVRGCVGGVGC